MLMHHLVFHKQPLLPLFSTVPTYGSCTNIIIILELINQLVSHKYKYKSTIVFALLKNTIATVAKQYNSKLLLLNGIFMLDNGCLEIVVMFSKSCLCLATVT